MVEPQRPGVRQWRQNSQPPAQPAAPATSAQLVKLVEQGIDIVSEGERADLRKRLDQTLRTAEGSQHPRDRGGRVQARQKQTHQRPGQRAGLPGRRRHRHLGAHRGPARRSGVGSCPRAAGGRGPRRRRTHSNVARSTSRTWPRYVSERGNPGNAKKLVAAEVFLPRKVLAGGLTLVDSPGRRRPGLDPHADHPDGPAYGGCHAAGLRCVPGIHRAGDPVPAAGHADHPERGRVSCPRRTCTRNGAGWPSWTADTSAQVSPDIPLFPVSSDLRLEAAGSRTPN